MIKKLICLIKGHKWKYITTEEHGIIGSWKIFQCSRCGKTKEEVI